MTGNGVASQDRIVRAAELEWMTMGFPAGSDESGGEVAHLVQRARAGDLGAFEQIVALHERRVFRTALRLLNHVEDAQDAAQEVYLRLYKHLRRLDERREFAPWLYRITVNVCRDMNRRRSKRAALSLDDLRSREPSFEPSDSGAGPDERAARAQQRRRMAEALKTLPDKQRAALVLRDLEGLTTREVARILGSSEATVRSQACTARLKLKKAMSRFSRGAK